MYCYFRLKSMFRHVGVSSRATKYIGNSGYPLFSQSNPILYHIIRFTTKICFAGRLKCYHNPVDIREGCFLIYFLYLKGKITNPGQARTQEGVRYRFYRSSIFHHQGESHMLPGESCTSERPGNESREQNK